MHMFVLKIDAFGKLTTHLYDKQDDFNISIFKLELPLNIYQHIPISSTGTYGKYISILIQYVWSHSTYDQISKNIGKLLTDKLMS
jgi:hypothetical protein